jgi:hypothetical protein
VNPAHPADGSSPGLRNTFLCRAAILTLLLVLVSFGVGLWLVILRGGGGLGWMVGYSPQNLLTFGRRSVKNGGYEAGHGDHRWAALCMTYRAWPVLTGEITKPEELAMSIIWMVSVCGGLVGAVSCIVFAHAMWLSGKTRATTLDNLP